jgi:hypothetical protein
MLPVQSGASWWIDTTLLAGSKLNRNIRGSALSQGNVMDLGDDADGVTSLISDVEEEGEVEETGEDHEGENSIEDTLEEQISEGSDELSASSETVAAMAMYLEIIEPIVRQRETAGSSYFHKKLKSEDDDETDEKSERSLLSDLFEKPAQAFAATRPNASRVAILAMLA